MDFLITVVPILLVIVVVVKDTWQTWKDGLALTLMRLGVGMVSLVLSFFLTRLLRNPAKVDAFGLGQLLVDLVPEEGEQFHMTALSDATLFGSSTAGAAEKHRSS